MQNIPKWILPVVVVVAVVAVIFSWKQPGQKPTAKPANTAATANSQTPTFVVGTVVSASANQIQLKSGSATLAVGLTANTKIFKQVKDAAGVVVSISATIKDLKPGVLIGIYYSSKSGEIYNADRVQIINQ